MRVRDKKCINRCIGGDTFMDYKRIYEELTNADSIADYTELHHITPKCMGGSNDKDNLVRLTAREHYIAHKLLTKIYPDNVKLLHAHSMMSAGRTLKSFQYEDAKLSKSKAMTLDNPVHKMSRKDVLDNIDKMRRYNIGDNNIMRRSPELREMHSQRMKVRNPMTLNPQNNRTAKPIVVEYVDGKKVHYPYAKKFSIDSGIPYSTVKYLMRKSKSSKKHNILSITQISEQHDRCHY
jgi:hypothetical protein